MARESVVARRAFCMLLRNSGAKLMQAFYKWRQSAAALQYAHAQWSHAASSAMKRASQLLLSSSLRALQRAWFQWLGHGARGGHAQWTLDRVVRVMKQKELAAAITQWRRALSIALRQDAAIYHYRRVLRRIICRELAQGFSAWRRGCTVVLLELTRQSYDENAILRRACVLLGDLTARAVSRAWSRWLDARTFHGQARITIDRVIRRMKQKELAAAMVRWSSSVAFMLSAAEAAKRCQRVFQRITSREIAKAFSSWCRATAAVTLERAQGDSVTRALHAQQQKAFAFTVRRASLVMDDAHSRSLLRAWKVWVESIARGEHVQMTIERVVRRMKQKELSAAMAQWNRVVALLFTTDEAVLRCERVFKCIAYRELARGFCTWRRAAMMVQLEQSQQQVLLGSAVRRACLILGDAQSRAVVRSWVCWVALLTREEKATTTITRVLQTMAHRDLAAALAQWSRVVTLVCETNTAVRLCDRMMKRISHRELARGFNTWRRVATIVQLERAQQRHFTGSAVRRASIILVDAQARTLMRAWGRWVQLLARDVHTRHLMERVFHRVVQKELTASFAQWLQIVEFDARAEEAVQRCQRVIKRITCRELAQSFHSWRRAAAAMKHEHVKQQHAEGSALRHACMLVYRYIALTMLGHAQDRTMMRLWDRWRAVVDSYSHAHTTINRVVRRKQQKDLAAAMVQWSSVAARLSQADAAALRCERVFKRITCRELTRGFNTWHRGVALARLELAQQKNAAGSAVRRAFMIFGDVQGRALLRAWSRWVEGLSWGEHTVSAVERVVRRMKQRELSDSFAQWRHGVALLIHGDEAAWWCMKVFRRLTCRELMRGFSAWRRSVTVARLVLVHETIINRVVRRITHKELAVALARWNRVVTKVNQTDAAVRKCERVLKRINSRELVVAFNTWLRSAAVLRLEHARTQRAMGYAVRRACLIFSNARSRALLRAWSRWVDLFSWNGHALRKIDRIFRVMGLKPVSAAMTKWHMVCTLLSDAEAATLQCERVLKRIKFRDLAHGFSSWRCGTALVQLERAHLRSESDSAMRRACLIIGDVHARSLARAWTRWLELAARTDTAQKIISRVVRRLAHIVLVSALAKWRSVVRRDVALATGCESALRWSRRLLARLSYRALVRSFNAWQRVSAAVGLAQAQLEYETNSAIRRVCAIFGNGHTRVLSRSWSTLVRSVKNLARLENATKVT